METLSGYAGKVLRVDLTTAGVSDEALDEAVLCSYLGGTGLGIKFLYDEVPPTASWFDPVNRLIIASGPLGGTSVSGSGTVSVITKGAQTNMAAATQANGFLGAYLKLCGYDAIVVQGTASDWMYLYIDEDSAQLRDAAHLVGKDTWETQEAIEQTDPLRKYSVCSIGPAGENLVTFAAIIADRGHVAAHNGVGAVMGSKKLKAIAVARGRRQVPVFDGTGLSAIVKRAFELAVDDPGIGGIHRLGTAAAYSTAHAGGRLPVKNYTTNIFPEHQKVDAAYTRQHFRHRKTPCWACQVSCCRMTTVTEGPYAGYVGEEPEYEGYAACSSQIGQGDAGAAVMLGNLIDRLGLDVNESGWVMGFAIECFERGLIAKRDTDGLELRWGNVEAAAELLRKIARREGIGELFAEGVRGAARTLGGEALSIGVFTVKGSSPRGHDHRAKWEELLDTCVSNTGTIECSNSCWNVAKLGIEPLRDRFNWREVATFNARVNGWLQWVDSLGICIFNFADPNGLVEAYNAITGRQLTVGSALTIGRRIVNQMRVYNLRCGLTPSREEPSTRYSSAPVDGPAAGTNVREHWQEMRRSYYRQMGWDEQTGCPTADTLMPLGLEHLLQDLST